MLPSFASKGHADGWHDHDTIATFRRGNRAAIEAAFLHVLELAREIGLMRLGTVSIDGTKIDANASKYCSIRYDRAKELREKLATDIATLMERAEMADATEMDHQALPDELARREAVETLRPGAWTRWLPSDAPWIGALMTSGQSRRPRRRAASPSHGA
ncbi:hypothetical protein EDC31_1392 [Acidomonas methanolica]|nr:hypothetical protein EDC31_1392 [Acidomonas methanolica]